MLACLARLIPDMLLPSCTPENWATLSCPLFLDLFSLSSFLWNKLHSYTQINFFKKTFIFHVIIARIYSSFNIQLIPLSKAFLVPPLSYWKKKKQKPETKRIRGFIKLDLTIILFFSEKGELKMLQSLCKYRKILIYMCILYKYC